MSDLVEEITLVEMRAHAGALCKRAASGVMLYVTDHGRRVAKITAATPPLKPITYNPRQPTAGRKVLLPEAHALIAELRDAAKGECNTDACTPEVLNHLYWRAAAAIALLTAAEG
jgi:antitoxin (DNA-binding transcriptional repressor) of toxin-antitoxin stability system